MKREREKEIFFEIHIYVAFSDFYFQQQNSTSIQKETKKNYSNLFFTYSFVEWYLIFYCISVVFRKLNLDFPSSQIKSTRNYLKIYLVNNFAFNSIQILFYLHLTNDVFISSN